MNLLLRPKYGPNRHRGGRQMPDRRLLEMLERQRLDDELIALFVAATTRRD